MTTDEKFMLRCLQLARCGEMFVAPNPMVGAVLVYDGRIIGEGYHAHYGEAHAEVNAFASVREDALVPKSTLYVSLEPCSHYGKTPPCVQLIIEKKVQRVVVGCIDPFALVRGRGIAILREAGITVDVGVLERKCLELNHRFIVFNTHHRPFVMLKWAQTSDGVMGKYKVGGAIKPLIISNHQTMRRVHHLRATTAAILVGYRTALYDNPQLTVRLWDGPNPIRVVVDKDCQLPPTLRIFDGKVRTVVFVAESRCYAAMNPNVEVLPLSGERPVVEQVLDALYRLGVQSLLVEGGANTLSDFMDAGLWDEAFVEQSLVCLSPQLEDAERAVYAPRMQSPADSVYFIGGSKISYYKHYSL